MLVCCRASKKVFNLADVTYMAYFAFGAYEDVVDSEEEKKDADNAENVKQDAEAVGPEHNNAVNKAQKQAEAVEVALSKHKASGAPVKMCIERELLPAVEQLYATATEQAQHAGQASSETFGTNGLYDQQQDAAAASRKLRDTVSFRPLKAQARSTQGWTCTLRALGHHFQDVQPVAFSTSQRKHDAQVWIHLDRSDKKVRIACRLSLHVFRKSCFESLAVETWTHSACIHDPVGALRVAANATAAGTGLAALACMNL